MKIIFHLLTAVLLVLLMLPQLVQAGGDMGKAPYDIGEKYYVRKDYRTALKYYQKALGRNDVRAHYRMGRIYEDIGKDRDALSHYQRFMDLNPSDTQRSDIDRRVRAIEERLNRKTTRSTQLLEQGKSLFMSGKYREAEQVLLQAAAKDESKPEIHFYLGEVYMKLEKYSKAKSEYNKAKKILLRR